MWVYVAPRRPIYHNGGSSRPFGQNPPVNNKLRCGGKVGQGFAKVLTPFTFKVESACMPEAP
jgi:hypothetical protein